MILDSDVMHDPRLPNFAKPDGWTEEQIKFYFEKGLKIIDGDTYTRAPEYIDLLVNQCLAQKHWHDAFTHFLEKIKEMGLQIETDQEKFKRMMERLFYLRSVRTMIYATGLNRFEDEIMKYEIGSHYAQLVIPQYPQPRTQKEPNHGPAQRRKPTPVTNPNPVFKPVKNEPPKPSTARARVQPQAVGPAQAGGTTPAKPAAKK